MTANQYHIHSIDEVIDVIIDLQDIAILHKIPVNCMQMYRSYYNQLPPINYTLVTRNKDRYYSVMTDRYDTALTEVNDYIETYLLASKKHKEVNTNEKHNQT
jgi:hypothetical protein